MKIKEIVNFIFELSQLKRQVHTGWLKVGVKNPVTVAEHSFRASQIGYILAVMEGDVDPEKVATMLIFHDNPETRTGDQDKVGARYYSKKEGEDKAFIDQVSFFSEDAKNKIINYRNEFEERNTKEGIIAKDADWLEVAFQAKEYLDIGYKGTRSWIKNIAKAVETESAKQIIKELPEVEFTDWFENLKKMTYKKL